MADTAAERVYRFRQLDWRQDTSRQHIDTRERWVATFGDYVRVVVRVFTRGGAEVHVIGTTPQTLKGKVSADEAKAAAEQAVRDRLLPALEEVGRPAVPAAVVEAAERVERWQLANGHTQEQFAIYRDHPAGNRLGGMDYQALQTAYREDCELLALTLARYVRTVAGSPPAGGGDS